MAKYIKESKFVILPYKDATGTQTVQLANYYGKLVLATKVGCFSEYITENVNGFFIEDNSPEGIIKAVNRVDAINLNEYKNRINNHLNKFNIKNTSNIVESIVAKM